MSSAPSRVTNEVPFSSRCTTKSIAKKSPTGSLLPAVPLAITPTFRPWTHTSDDSYIYQLSLVVATATVSFFVHLSSACAPLHFYNYVAFVNCPSKRYSSSCRYNERQLIEVTVVRRVRPRAERWCDCEGHRRWKRAGRTLFFH